MDPNAAQIMADSYREGAGHSRTAYRVRLVLSLDMTACPRHWASVVELASAYQSAYAFSEGKTTGAMRSLRPPFEEALQAAIRKDGVKIIKRKIKAKAPKSSRPQEIRGLSSEWKKTAVGWKARESQFKARIEYPHLLSSNREEDIELVRKHNAAHLVKVKGGPSTILKELQAGFKEQNPDWQTREAEFKNRVGNAGCLKKTKENAKEKA